MATRHIFRCNFCGFEIKHTRGLSFYLDLESGMLKRTILSGIRKPYGTDSILYGYIVNKYCSHCRKFMDIYYLKSRGENYNIELAGELLATLLPDERLYERVKAIKVIALMDSIRGSGSADFNEFIKPKTDLSQVKKSDNILINLEGMDYNLTLDGERIPLDTCPKCIGEIHYFSENDGCPRCGSKLNRPLVGFLD